MPAETVDTYPMTPPTQSVFTPQSSSKDPLVNTQPHPQPQQIKTQPIKPQKP